MKQQLAIKVLLGIIAAVTLFHLCILFKIVPYDIAWGGRLTNDSEMYVFESISIGINLIMALALLIKGRYMQQMLSKTIINGTLWVFLFLLALNTVGNLFAKTNFEKGFAVVTLALVILLWIVLRKKKK